MHLILGNEVTELTGKEVALLTVLHDSVNQTVEREVILNKVWGDEGDYIGRTLDVFISKLRKKLAADPDLKIANIRGVGYKLIVN
jgi:DNA-binding response OmpR family regulator